MSLSQQIIGENYTEIFNLREWDGSEEWVKETVRLHEYAGQSVEFAFHSNDNSNWASGVALDDIKLGMTPFWISHLLKVRYSFRE